MPLQRYGNPFVKPTSHASSVVISGQGIVNGGYIDESLSTNPADRYAAAVGYLSRPDPIYFTCMIGEGQYLRFETKYYEDDPFRVDPTTPTPTLSDVIPTTTGPSASEVEVTSGSGSVSVWMLRI
jgi:hypothetical protein